MDADPKKPRITFLAPKEPHVYAYVASADAARFYRMRFPLSAIEGVIDIDERSSALRLHSGVVVTVALPASALERLIDQRDFRSPDLDLCAATGEAAREILAPKLAERPLPLTQTTPLIIRALMRYPGSSSTVEYTFSEDAIELISQDTASGTKSGYMLTLKFNTRAKKCPFSHDGGRLDMPRRDYEALVKEAKENGDRILDLHQIFKDNPKKYGY